MTETTTSAPSHAAAAVDTKRFRDGLLLVDKPAGCTSHDVVAKARRILRQKKIGHCGTLDPAATGLLLLTLGRATRLTRFLIGAPKVYLGTGKLGVVTDTYDTTGETTAEAPDDAVATLDVDAIDAAMESFLGTYLQAPPPYCAKKVGGKKFYELARRGEAVPDTKKEVTVYELERHGDYRPDDAEVDFVLGCSTGTYARSIVHELGEKLGVGGALEALRRTKIGHFELEHAITLDDLRGRVEAGGELDDAFIPFDDIRLPFSEVILDAQQERRVQHGQTVLVRDLDGREGDWVKISNGRRHFIAVGSVTERIGAGNVG
ncbi:MAG: tRNA pseudouridine(55) synthase TruB, partial [Acidobacteriota bacterium]